MNHVILGNGEVGNAVKLNIKGNVEVYDKGEWERLVQKTNILHICIPYSKFFINIINNALNNFKPDILIIHSSVAPGTTKEIRFRTKLYSPIVGRHGRKDKFGNKSTLDESNSYFVKLFAGNKRGFDDVKKFFKYECEYWSHNTTSLEFAKISSTNYLYWVLLYEKFIYEECKKRGWNFEKVYTKWNKIYNKGYEAQGTKQFLRPVLKHDENKLPGGHCLVPNIRYWDDKISSLLRDYEEEKL